MRLFYISIPILEFSIFRTPDSSNQKSNQKPFLSQKKK